jgi:hypothetical protein
MNKILAHTIGVYLAKELMNRHIPCLSSSQCTNKIIQVTSGEADEVQRLEEVWFNKISSEKSRLTKGLKGKELWAKEKEATENSKNEWNESLKFQYALKEKYLPHILKCTVPYIDFSNEKINKKIKLGLIKTLWDWDFCEWSLKEDDIVFENETFYGETITFVTLKLDLERPISFTGEEWIEIKTVQK